MAADKHTFLKNGSDLFLRGALEIGDRVEAVRKSRALAQIIFGRLVPLASGASIKIDQSDLPDRADGKQTNLRCRPGESQDPYRGIYRSRPSGRRSR
jgi:hypothetical protein